MNPHLKMVAERIRAQRDSITRLPYPERRAAIQLAILEAGADLDADDEGVLQQLDLVATGGPIMPRVKALTALTDDELAGLIGKARPTVQAYVGGRLTERLDSDARRHLTQALQSRLHDINKLLEDLAALEAN